MEAEKTALIKEIDADSKQGVVPINLPIAEHTRSMTSAKCTELLAPVTCTDPLENNLMLVLLALMVSWLKKVLVFFLGLSAEGISRP